MFQINSRSFFFFSYLFWSRIFLSVAYFTVANLARLRSHLQSRAKCIGALLGSTENFDLKRKFNVAF